MARLHPSRCVTTLGALLTIPVFLLFDDAARGAIDLDD